jgi:lysyl-tRNA synthetase class 1
MLELLTGPAHTSGISAGCFMTADLVVPAIIEAVIARFDGEPGPLLLSTVSRDVNDARKMLENPSPAENLGAWSEALAFALTPIRGEPSPWKTYFGPVMTGTKEDGSPYYSPDIEGTPASVVPHWKDRAGRVQHTVLKARYADLAWDMSRAIAKANPDPEMARTAIDAYLASLEQGLHPEIHDQFNASLRALDLAMMVRDGGRIDQARAALLKLHANAVAAKKGLWWIAFDHLISDKRARLTDAERDGLIADVKAVIARCSNTSDPTTFDPHATEGAANRLIKYYNRQRKGEEAKRLFEVVARTFEYFASIAGAMVASAALQTAVNAYRSAGLPDESRRVRVLMEEKIVQSRQEMKPIVIERPIAREDMEKFLNGVVVEDAGVTLARIAAEFLERRKLLEKQVEELKEQAPLMATITRTVMAERHVAAKVGSVADDPFGRLIGQAAQSMALSDVWHINAIDRAIEVHHLTPGHFVGWVARTGLYDDLSLLMEGITAWFDQDFVKAVHVLVPQVEAGLRAIVGKLGKPVTKPHPTIQGVGVAINMGDILYSAEITGALGPDLTLHLLALYADPRGFNLRNDMAHGLLRADRMHFSIASRVLHTLLVLGIWDKLLEARKAAEARGE